MNQNSILYLSRADVEAVELPMTEIIEALEEMFQEKGAGRVEMPPKPGIHTRPDAFIHAMPAYVPALEAAGLKWIAGYPGNQAKGLPYITGLLVLNDPDTGLPLSIMDATWITATAYRRRHGRSPPGSSPAPDSATVEIVACGVQGRSNLEALACLFQIRHVWAYDLQPEISRRYAREMGARLGIEIEVVSSVREAVSGPDIVVTSGPILKVPTPAIEAGWLVPGAFAALVDFDSYWQGAAMRQADKLATDDHAQMRYYRQSGYFKETPEPYADLGEIITGQKPGRQSRDERTMTINLGLALEDVATAIRIYRRARSKGLGVELPL